MNRTASILDSCLSLLILAGCILLLVAALMLLAGCSVPKPAPKKHTPPTAAETEQIQQVAKDNMPQAMAVVRSNVWSRLSDDPATGCTFWTNVVTHTNRTICPPVKPAQVPLSWNASTCVVFYIYSATALHPFTNLIAVCSNGYCSSQSSCMSSVSGATAQYVLTRPMVSQEFYLLTTNKPKG